MAKFSMIIFTMVLSMMVVVSHAQSISCDTVVKSLTPCETYLKQGGDVPSSCCSGVRSLNSMASTTADRRAACQCMEAVAKAYSVNAQYAAALPKECNVNIGYPISSSVNCNNVN